MSLSIEAINNIYLLSGFTFGSLLTWIISSATNRWKRGRGLRRVPTKVERENEERMWKAKNDQAQGCREMLRSVGEWSVGIMIIFVLGMVLSR